MLTVLVVCKRAVSSSCDVFCKYPHPKVCSGVLCWLQFSFVSRAVTFLFYNACVILFLMIIFIIILHFSFVIIILMSYVYAICVNWHLI